MFRVLSSPNDLGSDAGNYSDTSAAYLTRTPAPMDVSPGALSPGSCSANGWGNYHAVIGRDERRAAGRRRLKHKWSAVKLASAGKDLERQQTHASGQTDLTLIELERSLALSPASHEVLSEKREQRSVGPLDIVQRERVRSPSSDSVRAEPAAVFMDPGFARQLGERINGELNRGINTAVERRLERTCKGKQSPTLKKKLPARVVSTNTSSPKANPLHRRPTSDSATATTADTQASVPSTEEEQQKKQFVDGLKRAMKTRAVEDLAADRGKRANISTLANILNNNDPSQQYTPAGSSVDLSRHRRPKTLRQQSLELEEQDFAAMQPQSFQVSTSRANDTSRPQVNASCAGSWGKCRCLECLADRWHVAAASLKPESDSKPKRFVSVPSPSLSHDIESDFEHLHDADTDLASMENGSITPRYLEDGPTWTFDTLSLHDTDTDTDSSTDNATALGSDNGESLGARTFEDFGNEDEAVHSRSSSPVQYTPTFESDDERISKKYVNEANSMLREVVEPTVEKDLDTEFITSSKPSGLVRSEPWNMSFEHALSVFNLDGYLSVDMGVLQSRLQGCLSQGSVDRIIIANAFTTIVMHQDETESWALRLRWESKIDRLLLDNHEGTHHNGWETMARSLNTTQEDCRQRWEILKPKDWAPDSICRCAARTGGISCCCCPDKNWTPTMDTKLLSLKADRCSWVDIARHFDLEAGACKHRFKKIKPQDWKPNSKKQIKKWKAAAAKMKKMQEKATVVEEVDATFDTRRAAPYSTSEANSSLVCGHHVDDTCRCGDFNDCGCNDDDNHEVTETAREMDLNEAYALFEIRKESEWPWVDLSVLQSQMLVVPPSEVARLEKAFNLICNYQASRPRDGWHERSNDIEYCWYCGMTQAECDCAPNMNSWDASSHHQGDSDPVPEPYVPPTVTYWATIESAGKEIHVPIADKHICGPEKSIATGDMQKVWKWVYDKGLGRQIGLQDAFDLAQSMYKEDGVKEAKDEQVQSDGWSTSFYRFRDPSYDGWNN